MHDERAGFTLVELLVALSIGAVVLVSARTLLDGLASHTRVAVQAMHSADARANSERMAQQIFGNAALAPGQAASFAGTPTEATFESWCPSPRGGLEPCHVRLAIVNADGKPAVVLSMPEGQTMTLLRGRPARLRYLSSAADGGHWDDAWKAFQTPPLAVEATAGDRTLFFRIGERR
jgi:prepilin-type N-terminal cleavage/methylation domain-containing protein